MEIKKLNGEKELDSQRRLIFKQSRSTAVKIVCKKNIRTIFRIRSKATVELFFAKIVNGLKTITTSARKTSS